MATTETFWDQIGAYNDATFPLQMIMVVVAMILTYYVFAKPTRKTNRQNALECRIYEDGIQFGAGAYGLIMAVKNWKVIGKTEGLKYEARNKRQHCNDYFGNRLFSEYYCH